MSYDSIWLFEHVCVFSWLVLPPPAAVALLQPVRPPGLDPLLLQDLGVVQELQAGQLTDHILPEGGGDNRGVNVCYLGQSQV